MLVIKLHQSYNNVCKMHIGNHLILHTVLPLVLCPYSSSSSASSTTTPELETAWEVYFELGDEVRSVLVGQSETLLQAAERVSLRTPYDCRRGNCVTCAARFTADSSYNLHTAVRHNGVEDPDTFLCDEAKDQGFFLSCCSYAVGPGLRVKLGQQSEAWQIQYCDRFLDEDTTAALRAASAAVMRDRAERHPAEFRDDLEQQFDSSSSSSSSCSSSSSTSTNDSSASSSSSVGSSD
jgi:ferredoxin